MHRRVASTRAQLVSSGLAVDTTCAACTFVPEHGKPWHFSSALVRLSGQDGNKM